MSREFRPQRIDELSIRVPKFKGTLAGPYLSPTETPTEQTYPNSVDDLVTRIVQATNISKYTAVSSLRYMLRKNPDIEPKKVRLEGRSGRPMLFFTDNQGDSLVAKTIESQEKKARRRSSSPSIPKTKNTQSSRHINSPPTQNSTLRDQQPQAIFTIEDSTVSSLSPPPAETKPQEVTKVPPENELLPVNTEREKMFEKATLYLLSKIVEGTLHREVFGRNTDDQLKKDFVVGFSRVLEKYWNLDPKNLQDISEAGSQIMDNCRRLKRLDYVRIEIIQNIMSRLGILPQE